VGVINQGGFSFPESLTTGNSSEKVFQDLLPQAVLYQKSVIMYFILAMSEAYPKGKRTT
jgi:hypothetical protein